MKPTAKAAIQALKAAGVEKTVMLTGDRDQVAQQVAGALGVDQVYSSLLPADKVEKVEQLLEEKPPKKKLAFVGDGINDAPVLSRADIGIAMGAMGSDAAIEAADVVLMDDDPMQIPKAIKISRKCLGIVYQNIVFAIGVKGVCLVLGALGIANMWLAIFADVGVMILAVLNAIRALFVKRLWTRWETGKQAAVERKVPWRPVFGRGCFLGASGVCSWGFFRAIWAGVPLPPRGENQAVHVVEG